MNLTKIAASAFITFSLSGNIMASESRLSQDEYNLADARHVMEQNVIDTKGWLGRLISIDYILEHGEVPIFGSGLFSINVYSVDFNIDDEYNRSLKKVEYRVLNGIKNSSNDGIYNRYDKVSLVLSKDHWSKEDYIDFERNLSSIISYEVSQISGLRIYRSKLMGHQVKSSSNLNDLSIDIKNNTATLDFDCDGMSITEGVIAHRVKSKLLGDGISQESNNYKIRGKDYIAMGLSKPSGNNKGPHAVILSGLTGNLIEGIHNSSLDINEREGIWEITLERYGSNGAYKQLLNKNPIADFINGKPIFTSNGDVFGSSAANISSESMINYIPDYVDLQDRVGSASIRELMINIDDLIGEYKRLVIADIYKQDAVVHYTSIRDAIISNIDQISGVLEDKNPLNISEKNLQEFKAKLNIQMSGFMDNSPDWADRLTSAGNENASPQINSNAMKLTPQ